MRLRWALIHMTGILKKGEVWTKTQRTGHVKMNLGLYRCIYQPRNTIGSQKLEEMLKHILPSRCRRDRGPADTDSDFWPPEERQSLLC